MPHSVSSVVAEIARREMGFETLDARRNDSLDFREIGVWQARAALEAAYAAGAEAARGAAAARARPDSRGLSMALVSAAVARAAARANVAEAAAAPVPGKRRGALKIEIDSDPFVGVHGCEPGGVGVWAVCVVPSGATPSFNLNSRLVPLSAALVWAKAQACKRLPETETECVLQILP